MAPKIKDTGSKEATRAADSFEKGLNFFQEAWAKSKSDAYNKKGGMEEEVQRLANEGSVTERRLARLCCARVQFENYASKGIDKSNLVYDQITQWLDPLIDEVPRSLTAVCLLAAAHAKLVDGSTGASVRYDMLKSLVERCGSLDTSTEDKWLDPAEEDIVQKDKQKWEEYSGATKLDRLKSLYKALVKKRDGACNKTQQMAVAAGIRTEQAAQPKLEGARAPQQQPEEQQADARCDLAAYSATQKNTEECRRLKARLERKLQAAGPEGSAERIKAFCDLFTADFAEYDGHVTSLVNTFLSDQGLTSSKSIYLMQAATQLKRFRAGGVLLQLNRPDLKEATKLGSMYTMESNSVQPSKEEKGDVGVRANKAGGKKGASKGKEKEKPVVVSTSDAPAMPSTVKAAVEEFMDWFIGALKADDDELRRSLLERGLDLLAPSDLKNVARAPDERKLLESCQRKAPTLVDVLRLQLSDPDTDLHDASPAGRLVSEIVDRMRLGEQLLVSDAKPREISSVGISQVDADKFKQQRISFAEQLSQLPLLLRHDVLDAAVQQMAIMYSEVENKDALLAVDLNDPNTLIASLGDPLSLLLGYTQVLLGRGELPVEVWHAVPEDRGYTPVKARLVRLCSFLLYAGEGPAADVVIAALVLHRSTKKEHVELLRLIYGELPSDIAKRVKEEERKMKQATGNGNAHPEGEEPPASAVTSDSESTLEEADGKERALQAVLDFDIRTDLPEAERLALKISWANDIMDAVAEMEAGNCGIGRRLTATMRAFIAQAINARPADVNVSSKGLLTSLTKLDTKDLLYLRSFVLTQLGTRVNSTLRAMVFRSETWHWEVREEIGLEALPGGDKVRLSEATYNSACYKAWHAKQRHIIRLRILHAMKRVLDEAKGESAGSGAGATASGVGAASADGGGSNTRNAAGGGTTGKKKGKGGGGAAAPQPATSELALPPLPPGVPPLEVADKNELFDYLDNVENLNDAELVKHFTTPAPLCSREGVEILEFVLDPPKYDLEPGTEAAEVNVIEEIVSQVGLSNDLMYNNIPPFTIRDVIDELARASLLEGLRREGLDNLLRNVHDLLKLWSGLAQECNDKKFIEAVRGQMNPWAVELLAQVKNDEVEVKGTWADRLSKVDGVKTYLSSGTLKLKSRCVRFAALPHAARFPETEKLWKALEAKTKEEPSASSNPNKTTKGKEKNKPQRPEAKRLEDLQVEVKNADEEKKYLEVVVERAKRTADKLLLAGCVRDGGGYAIRGKDPPGMCSNPIGTSPEGAARRVVEAMEAVQLYALQLSYLEALIEASQVQARSALYSALVTEPVLEFGLAGLGVYRPVLKSKLEEAATIADQEKLLEDEAQQKKKEKEKAKLKETRERERKQVEEKKREEERRKIEEERKKEEEEEEARAQKQREEEEARRKAEDEAKTSRSTRPTVQTNENGGIRLLPGDNYNSWSGDEEENEPPARPPPTAQQAKQQPAQQPSAMMDRLKASKEQQQQGPSGPKKDSPMGLSGGVAAPSGGGRGVAHGSGPGQGAAAASARGVAPVSDIPASRKGSGQQQQQQQQAQSRSSTAKGGAAAQGISVQGAASGPAPAGKEGGSRSGQAAGASRNDRGGQQQQHLQQGQGAKGPAGGKTGGAAAAGGKGGAAAGAAAGAASLPSQPRTVPGFDPEAHGLQSELKGKGRRNRRHGGGGGGGGGGPPSGAPGGGGGGGITDSAAEAAAKAAAHAATGGRMRDTPAPPPLAAAEGDEVDEEPHPPAAPSQAQAGVATEAVAMVDLTEGDQPETPQPDMEVANAIGQYVLVHPYTFPPPEGWKVQEGYLIPADQDLEAELAAAVESQCRSDPEAFSDPTTLANFNASFKACLAQGFLNERGIPDVPPEAFLHPKPAEHRQVPYAMPYAVAADGPPDKREEPPAAEPPQAPLAYSVPDSMGPPVGPVLGAMPGPMPFPLPLPPMHMHLYPPYMRPPPPGIAGMPPGVQPFLPMPGPFMAGMPYGAMPPIPAPVPMPPAEQRPEEADDEQDDLLGLLGVSQPAKPVPPVQPTVLPARPPVIELQSGGLPAYGAYAPPVAPPPYGMPPTVHAMAPPVRPAPVQPQPQAANSRQEEQEQEEVLQVALQMANPYAAQVSRQAEESVSESHEVEAQSAISTPAALPAMSWAQRARAGGPAKAAAAAPRAAARAQNDREEDIVESEEKALQLAMHRSMQDNMSVAFPPLGGASGPSTAGTGRLAAASATQDQSSAMHAGTIAGTGLVNRVGEYNCFLNVIIQCLWHCSAFREQMSTRRSEDFDGQHSVVAALLRLFRALDLAETAREQQRRQLTGSAETAAERHVVDPSELREALDALGVRAGEMNDASEVLGALFECLNRAPGLSGGSGEASVVDSTFGLQVSEEVRCTASDCGRISHVVAQHVEYFMIITATGLRDIKVVIDDGNINMARMIREIELQNVKGCDTDPPYNGCGRRTHVTRTLHNVPHVITVQLVWEQDVPAEAIAGTLALVDTVMNPKDIFPGGNCPADLPSYVLHGMFCYYGQHYFAFINRGPVEPDSAQEWVMFDDATVSAVGGWQSVINKCCAGRIQPAVLFYQRYQR